MPLTQQQKDRYLAFDGTQCPYCRSENITALDFDGWHQKSICGNCGKTWHNYYLLVDMREETGKL